MASDEAEKEAQDAAGCLANVLEEVGFDVGRAFPELDATISRAGTPMVSLGRVTAEVAMDLVSVLTRAAHQGVALSEWSALWCGAGTPPGAEKEADRG